MKLNPLGFFCGALVSAFGIVTIPDSTGFSQAAPQQTRFVCSQIDGIPVTIAKSARNGDVVMIKWTKDMGTWSPQSRCEAVARRFQDHYNNQTLRFLTSGKMNGQTVICVAQNKFEGCLPNGLLFTLKPTDSAPKLLVSLLNQSRYATAPAIIQNCVPKKDYDLTTEVYIDIAEFLNQCPPESSSSGNGEF